MWIRFSFFKAQILFYLPVVLMTLLSSHPGFAMERSSTNSDPYFCVDRFSRYLKINAKSQTQSSILQSILSEDMYLDDLPEIQALLQSVLESPQPLSPMLNQIRTAVVEKHPLVNEFLCRAFDEKLFPRKPDRSTVIRTLHHMFLLDRIVQEMAKNPRLTQVVNSHLLEKRKQLGAHSQFLPKLRDLFRKAGPFGAVKALTLDATMEHYDQIRREEMDIWDWDVAKRRAGLSLHIMQATLTDFFCGFTKNACVGLKLAFNPVDDIKLTGGMGLEYNVSEKWAALYETWNLAFITGHLKNLHLLYPKLLIPQVIAAESKDYVFHRVLALSLSIHFYLLREMNGKPDVELPHATELATLWEEINSQGELDSESAISP